MKKLMKTIKHKIKPYIKISRFDHWFKNVFVLPGTAVAVYTNPELLNVQVLFNLIVALLAIGFVASSNYVLNELLDAPFDALHPVKKHRPIPSGKVNTKLAYGQWLILGCIGLGVAWLLGKAFFSSALALWIMGCIYNVPPLRSKDKPYVDVLSESINNPLRLLMGWYCTDITVIPPVSLLAAYWMVGAFFMAVKRFAEYRRIDNPEIASKYRRSFASYTEETLLVSITFYGIAFGLFFGIFLMRYSVELILSVPLIAGFIAWYMHLGFQEDSPTQYPEKLYLQKGFVIYTFLCVGTMIALLFIHVPMIQEIFVPTMPVQPF